MPSKLLALVLVNALACPATPPPCRVNNMRTWRTDLAVHYPGAPQRALVHGGFVYSYNSRWA